MTLRRKGQGTTLVLQHGFLGSADYWQPLVDCLPDQLDIVAPSLPGFSRSNRYEPSFDGFARALVDTLDELSIERFSLAGHSMGGMIAQRVAMGWPERVTSLVLYGTAATGLVPGRFESPAESVSRVKNEGLRATAERIVVSWLREGSANPYYRTCMEGAGTWSVKAAINALTVLPNWDARAELASLDLPTLVICGDMDRSTPPCESFTLWSLIRQAHLCVLPGCAHAAHLDKVELFSGIITEFIMNARA